MCGCHDATALEESDASEVFGVYPVPLGQGDAREFGAQNWITDVRPPIFRNPLGGPAEAPAPDGMNASIMPIIEARSMDVAPWRIPASPESQISTPDYIDESALYLDTGYIGDQVQEFV